MTRDDLVAVCRSITDDIESADYLWSDDEFVSYLKEAEREAVIRANLLYEDANVTYCSLTLVPGAAVYSLNSLVYEVLHVSLDSYPLTRKSLQALDEEMPGWKSLSGTPEYYILQNKTVRLVPTPSEIKTVDLVVHRYPVPMLASGPEIDPEHHMKLVDWALYLAYKKRDADEFIPGMADSYAAAFTKSFGEPKVVSVVKQHAGILPIRSSGWI